MKTMRSLLRAVLAAALFMPILNVSAQAPRVRESLDADWRFTKGDPEEAGTNLAYSVARPWLLPLQNPFTTNAPAAMPTDNLGAAVPYAQPGFDDRNWRQLNLPHDFGIEGPFQQALPGETAKLPWFGVAWYRKHFDVPAPRMPASGCAWMWTAPWPMPRSGSTAIAWAAGPTVMRRGSVDLTPYVNFGGANIAGHPPGQSPGFLALVSRRRHLPQCLARQNRAGARRALGHLRHHAGVSPADPPR